MKLYIAHPITGLSGEKALNYFEELTMALSPYVTVLSPMSGKGHLISEDKLRPTGYDQDRVCNNHAIFRRDMWMVDQADIILCDLTGATRVSIGCSIEVGVAATKGKHVIAVMEPDNCHRHAFILEAADIVFEGLPEAIDYIRELAGYPIRIRED